ncbi:YceI family protein [Streptomyces sp. NBC_00445]|uniref:YceI family protein n=1 Tax=unclassified Streptomyces TaxID=2593676 RepID=UPI002E1E7405|nr:MULTISPECIES: YceI family protein [unclassified Streptomyces]
MITNVLDGADPTRSEAHVAVQVGSLDTGISQRDAHVTGPGFLDSATFPLMTFRSTGVVDAGDGQFRMSGYLRQNRVGFEGTATLKRSDWRLTGTRHWPRVRS